MVPYPAAVSRSSRHRSSRRPPWGAAAGADAVPPTATVDSSFTVSSCPAGHSAGADDSAMGRFSSNVSPQVRQRYS
ncbi:hypothetical protein GCM10020256_54210 [Streptomyces thermocoprophilus]